MSATARLTLTVVTPERSVVERAPCDYVSLPGELGELGILPGHTPLVALLGVGRVTWTDGGRKTPSPSAAASSRWRTTRSASSPTSPPRRTPSTPPQARRGAGEGRDEASRRRRRGAARRRQRRRRLRRGEDRRRAGRLTPWSTRRQEGRRRRSTRRSTRSAATSTTGSASTSGRRWSASARPQSDGDAERAREELASREGAPRLALRGARAAPEPRGGHRRAGALGLLSRPRASRAGSDRGGSGQGTNPYHPFV